MFKCLHTPGDFQERRPTAADWLHDDFFKVGHPVLCPVNNYDSTVDTAKCICIFFNTNVFWFDGDVLKRSKHVTAIIIHTVSCIDCC